MTLPLYRKNPNQQACLIYYFQYACVCSHAYQKRAKTEGLDFSVSYTWSKNTDYLTFLNPTDPTPSWYIDPYDIPQQLKVSAVWYLPLGSGQRFASGANPVLNRLIGGWSVSGQARAQAGMPLALYLNNIRKPGIDNLDLSVAKRMEFKERYSLTLRADFINATNTTEFFSGPDTNANDTTFGKIAGFETQSNDPRVIMMSLRFRF